MRLKPGDEFIALDGLGKSWLCSLSDRSRATVRDLSWPSVPPLLPDVHLGLALCKGQRFESAIEKLAELGLSRLTPLHTERTERKAPSSGRWERWNEIARAGSALAGRLLPLRVEQPASLEEFAEGHPEDGPLFFCQHQAQPLALAFEERPHRFRAAIGPEGGFSPSEVERLQTRAVGVSLGPYNLRVETAALTFLARTLQFYEGNVPSEGDR